MAAPKMSTVLRRFFARFGQEFNQCRATRVLDAHRAFSTHKKSSLDDAENDSTAPKQRRKTEPVPKITLLSPDDSITVTELEDAQRLAKRRKFTLIKVSDLDSKTQRPLYKLVNDSSFFEDTEDIKDTDNVGQKHKVHIKLLYISAKIAQHDLLTKMKNVIKLLKKGFKVKIVIILDNIKEDKVQNTIENVVKNDGKVQKMPSKKNTVLLLIIPLDKNNESSRDNKEETVSNTIQS